MPRPHPLYLYYDAKKWLLILLIPVLRAILSWQDPLSAVLSSTRDVILAAALVGYSVLKWRSAQYTLKDGLTFHYGLIYQRTLRVTEEDTASVVVERSPLMWLTGGRLVRFNTAGLRRKSDAVIFLPARATRLYLGSLPGDSARHYAGQVLPVVIMAASSSNAAIGLLALAPILRQAGKLLGREVTGEVYGLVERLISFGLPPLLNATASVLFLGWCYSFARTFVKVAGFYGERTDTRLHLISGLFTRCDTYIECSRITALELRQTLLMRLFGLHTVSINAAGYGREKDANPLIIPAARPREIRRVLNTLLPDFPTCAAMLRPVKRAWLGYSLPPLLLIAASLLPLMLGPVWRMLSFIGLIAGIWWLTIRIAGCRLAGFGINGQAVTLRYTRGLALYEMHIPQEVADCIVLTRNPFQRMRHTCTLELRCYGEKRRRHRVRTLAYSEASRLVSRYYTDSAN